MKITPNFLEASVTWGFQTFNLIYKRSRKLNVMKVSFSLQMGSEAKLLLSPGIMTDGIRVKLYLINHLQL